MDDGRALTALPLRFAAWFEARGWPSRAPGDRDIVKQKENICCDRSATRVHGHFN